MKLLTKRHRLGYRRAARLEGAVVGSLDENWTAYWIASVVWGRAGAASPIIALFAAELVG